MEEAAHQRDFGSKQMQTRSDSLGVFTEDTRAFFDDVVDTRVATRCSFKHYRREHRDLVFVRRLCPANKLIKIVQGECRQNFRIWPNVSANERERSTIFLRPAAGKKNSRAIYFPRQSGKNFAQTFWGCQPQIGRRQFSLIENHPLRAGVSTPGYSFH